VSFTTSSELLPIQALASGTSREDLQLALAIAEEDALRSLLCDCLPSLAIPNQIGQVQIQVGVPTANVMLDGLLQFERIRCALAAVTPTNQPFPYSRAQGNASALAYSSTLQTLVEQVTPRVAIATLTHVGFNPDQVHHLLHLPSQAWHKTWWQQWDEQGQFFQHFYRWMRLRCHPNGNLTLQYQDHYTEAPPPCFYSEVHQVPILVKSPAQSFAETLGQLNHARTTLETPLGLVIADHLTDLETEGFIRQHVSLYILPPT
jgi:hypothetical protein